ncbi:MAG TPA: ribose-phosphate diphosphokinase [Pseudonocardia sp.]|nr:ribose-phosphate diphosphokinase [Pseudonocardia sp.]
MDLRIVPGSGSAALATAMAARLGVAPVACTVERFPDGELRPRVGPVHGADVYVVQSTGPPVDERLVELLLLLDACRRGGAGRITAVVPYFGYARQDRRTRAGEALGARLCADVLTAAGAHRLVVVDPHTSGLESMFAIPVVMLTAVPLLTRELVDLLPATAVVVAPDLGAVALAEHVAARLDRPVAAVRKTRLSGTSVRARELAGDVQGRPVLVVDDMISTGATIGAATDLLLSRGAARDVTVAAVHGPLVPDAIERLKRLPLRLVLVTDTALAVPAAPPVRVCPTAGLLGDAVGRLHHGEPLDDILART